MIVHCITAWAVRINYVMTDAYGCVGLRQLQKLSLKGCDGITRTTVACLSGGRSFLARCENGFMQDGLQHVCK